MQFDAILDGHTCSYKLCPLFSPTNAVPPLAAVYQENRRPDGPFSARIGPFVHVERNPHLLGAVEGYLVALRLYSPLRKGAVRVSASLVVGIAMAVHSILYPT